ncbi:MAG: PVC-type heme-binding CxxCH protein [Pirellulales bacterium]
MTMPSHFDSRFARGFGAWPVARVPGWLLGKATSKSHHRRGPRNTARRAAYLFALVCSLPAIASGVERQSSSRPLTPQASLGQIVVDAGLKAELVASEPNIVDPVAIRFDEEGRLWVVEMRDYPTGPTEENPALSRVSVLQDVDGDGFFEYAHVFADDLSFATGVQPWKGGAFVTMAGKVAYLKDTDGDGKADVFEPWFTGFAEMNTQLRANHPQFALDNHIYVANGLRGGTIVDAQHPERPPVSISGRDFRFDPGTRKYEAVAGVGQFGLTFNDFGDRFVCTNRNPAIHVVLEDRLLKKNPLAAVATPSHDVAKAGPDSHLYPIGRSWTTSNLHAGQFTAACGVHVYRGDALASGYYGNIFTCDPTAHIVHREIMQPSGVSFESTPASDKAEFFASRDEWCCPVNLETGPDGALYVVDMYRAIIEHPEWMPEELRHRPNMRAGNDRGRIFRIVPAGFQRPPAPSLSKLKSSELVDLLAKPNAWWRESAARVLVERQDTSVVPLLQNMALKNASQVGRIQALHLLAGLHSVDEAILDELISDSDPKIVEQAIIVASNFGHLSDPLQHKIGTLARHTDARVRFRALLTAAPLPLPPEHPADQWEIDATLIATGERGGDVLTAMLRKPDTLRTYIAEPEPFVRQLAKLAAATKNGEQQSRALDAIFSSPDFKWVGLAAFIAELVRGGDSLAAFQARVDHAAATKLDEALQAAAADAVDTKLGATRRCQMIDLLAFAANSDHTLLTLATGDPNQAIRLRAIEALGNTGEVATWREILASLSIQTPAIQRAILDGMLTDLSRVTLLLDSVAAGEVKPTVIDPVHAKQLLSNQDPAIKRRAEKLLAAVVNPDREEALAKYRPVLDLKADAHHGRQVFEKNCSICHRIGGVGVQFAPDISDSRERTPLQLLTDVLQPNRAVDSNYFSYTVVTNDGRAHRGVLGAETATSVTIKQQEGKSETILRDEIEDLHSDGVSYMPEGLEKDIPPQDMADLISFIKNWRYLEN